MAGIDDDDCCIYFVVVVTVSVGRKKQINENTQKMDDVGDKIYIYLRVELDAGYTQNEQINERINKREGRIVTEEKKKNISW